MRMNSLCVLLIGTQFCSVSSLSRGEPQNLQATEEDLHGADQLLVNNNAFFGGEILEETYILFSSSSTSLSCPASSLMLPNFGSTFDESSRILLSLLTPTLKNITRLRHESKVQFGRSVALFE